MCIVQVQSHMNEIFHFMSDVGTGCQTFEIRFNDNTFIIQISHRKIGLCSFRTSRSGEIIVLLQCRTRHFILPINVIQFANVLFTKSQIGHNRTITTRLTHCLSKEVRIGHIYLVTVELKRIVGGEIHFCLTLASTFCGNHNNTIGTTCSVNSRSRSIF